MKKPEVVKPAEVVFMENFELQIKSWTPTELNYGMIMINNRVQQLRKLKGDVV